MMPAATFNVSYSYERLHRVNKTGDWDIFLGPPEREWVSKRREFSGFAIVNKITPASLGYLLSVFNQNSTLKCSNAEFENYIKNMKE